MDYIGREVIDVNQGKNFVEMHIQGSDKRKMRLKLTSPLINVWRLQSASMDIPYDDNGAMQMMDETAEVRAADLNSQLDLRLVQGDSSAVIDIPGSTAKTEIFFSPFRMVFSEGEHACLKIVEILITADGLRAKCPLNPAERIYGTGERFDEVNQKGKKVTIWAEDKWCQTEGNSYLPIPFIISTRKYALLANRFESTIFDLGKNNGGFWTLTQNNAPLDIYIFLSGNPQEIYRKLNLLWGFPSLPPEWGFGVLVCRHAELKEFGTVKGIRAMVSKMKEHDLPWSGVIIEGWDTYDSDTYEELKNIVQELHGIGKKVLVYDACGRLPEKYWKRQKAQPEFFVRDQQGNRAVAEAPHYNPKDAPDRRESSFLDVTNPAALKWWKDGVWKRLLKDIGIDGAKIDFCEQFPENENVVLFSGSSVKGIHHFYPVKYNIIMAELFKKYGTDGGLCWSRGGSIGAHKYPFVWCGDQLREFRFLKAILSATLSSGMSGIPFVGHDLGGYLPAENNDDEVGVFVRGVQLSCFSANMQTHGMVTRPYDFSPDIVKIYRLYSKIHYALMPYLQEQARICGNTGLPLLRHLFLHYPEENGLWDCDDQYFLGEDILAAPVLDNARMRDILLPPGEWVGLFDGKKYGGQQKIAEFPVPLENIPVFVAARPKSTVLIPLIDEIRNLFKLNNSR